MSTIPKKFLLILLIVIVVLVSWFIYSDHLHSAKLTLEVTPAGSNIKLNGKGVREGLSKVKPGHYYIKFSHAGFADITKNIQLSKDDNKYVGVALSPNSPTTAGWYSSHPTDAKKAEGISSKNFDQVVADTIKQFPLVKELPFVDQLYRVDYGSSKQKPNDPQAIALYITYYSELGKQQALDWIKFKGYDPSKLEIIYKKAF